MVRELDIWLWANKSMLQSYPSPPQYSARSRGKKLYSIVATCDAGSLSLSYLDFPINGEVRSPYLLAQFELVSGVLWKYFSSLEYYVGYTLVRPDVSFLSPQ